MESNIVNERFSVFPCGWKKEDGTVKMNQRPQQTQTIGWVGEWIRSPWCAVEATVGYRAMLPTASREERNNFKLEHFQYATFSGIFTYRNAKSQVTRTPFLTIDIDDLGSLQEAQEVREMLCQDTEVVTALCFVSPSGRGVKWIVELPGWTDGKPFREQFEAMRDYVAFNYGLAADRSGSDVCRACFLGWDPDCYVNPKYVLPHNFQLT